MDTTKIKLALQQLDHADDSHWTADHLPRTGVVQRLANDTTISRTDINEALPGFVRKVGDEMGDPPEQTGDNVPAVADAAPVEPIVEAEGDGELMTQEEVEAILDQNIRDAEATLQQSQRDIVTARKAEDVARKALAEAHKDKLTKFPPLTPAENIQLYLRSELEKRAAAAGVTLPPIDQAFSRANTRGWRRPVHMQDGSVVMPERRQGSPNRSVDGHMPQSKMPSGFGRPVRAVVGVDGRMVMPKARGVA